MNTSLNTVYIIDISSVINKHSNGLNFQKILQYYPIRDIIDDIMHSDYYVDYSSLVWENIHKRIPNGKHDEILSDDYIELDLFVEELIEDLDRCILNSVNMDLELENYVLHQWVGNSSIMLISKPKYHDIINNE